MARWRRCTTRASIWTTPASAPFTGRIGNHQVSVGNLVAGSRGAVSPTTLLTTLVSLDPIYLDFDMSEADYNSYLGDHESTGGPETVGISLADATDFDSRRAHSTSSITRSIARAARSTPAPSSPTKNSS